MVSAQSLIQAQWSLALGIGQTLKEKLAGAQDMRSH